MQRPSHETYRAVRSFGSLDGIRCLSIVPVVFLHANGGLSFGRFSHRGFLGVDMFFVLSGYLIVTLLLRERDRKGDISLKDFYLRRTLRIMPLYYGILTLCALLFGVFLTDGHMAGPFFRELPYYLTYTTNWVPIHSFLAVSWSLSAEEQFYLCWPAIQKFAGRPLVWLAALLALSQAIHFGLLDGPMSWLGYSASEPTMLRQTTFTPILLGVGLAHALHDRTWFDRIARVVGHPVSPLVCGLSLVALLQFAPDDLRGWPRATVHLLMTAFLAGCVVREDHVIASWLRLAVVRRIGAISYGMYLWHMFVAHFTVEAHDQGALDGVWVFPLTLLGTILVADLSFRYFETPFLRLKARFAR